MLFAQLEKGELNPARIISSFEDSEDQNKAASLFNARLKRLETKEEQEKAVSETLRKVKKYSLDERAETIRCHRYGRIPETEFWNAVFTETGKTAYFDRLRTNYKERKEGWNLHGRKCGKIQENG